MKRPRLNKQPLLVASTSNDFATQTICKHNNRLINKTKKTSYILTCFGKSKNITKQEYNNCIKLGLETFVKTV